MTVALVEVVGVAEEAEVAVVGVAEEEGVDAVLEGADEAKMQTLRA